MYADKYGSFFGRYDDDGNVIVLHIKDGTEATELDASVYPVGSELSARYEHPEGITLRPHDAEKLGIEIEE